MTHEKAINCAVIWFVLFSSVTSVKLLSLLPFVALVLLARQNLAQPQTSRATLEGTIIRLTASLPQPIPKVRVTLIRRLEGAPRPANSDSSSGLSATTNNYGKFAFPNVEPGFYDVKVQAEGYIGPGSSVELESGDVIKDMSIEMKPVANVSGRVLDLEAQPLVNVPVQLLKSSYDRNGQHSYESAGIAMTNDRGEFRLYWVTPGRYYLLAGRPTAGFNPMEALISASFGRRSAAGNDVPPVLGYAFYPGVTDFADAKVLDLQPGSDLHVDLPLKPSPRTFTIRAKVIDSRTGKPPARASASIRTETPGDDSSAALSSIPRNIYSTTTGQVEFQGILPGNYMINVVVDDPVQPGGVLNSQAIATIPVTVSSADVEGLVLSVAPPLTITGRLRIEGELPSHSKLDAFQVRLLPVGVSSAVLQYAQMRFYTPDGFVNADGTFRVENVFPGDYRVYVSLGPARLQYEGIFIKFARYEATDVLMNPMHVEANSSGQLDISVTAGGGKITGTVIDARSQAVAGASVVLVPERLRFRTDLYQILTANEKGAFSIQDIAPGDYRLFSWESIEENDWFDPDLLARSESKGVLVHVTELSTENTSVRIIPAGAQ